MERVVLLGRCPGDGLVAEPPDGQFEFCHPRRSETRRPASGTRPQQGPNNETPAARASTPSERARHRVEELPMFVGWDWASTTHDVTVIDDAGNIVDRWAPEHTELGLDATMARLTRRRPPRHSHPPQRLPRRAAPLGCGRSQVRSR